MTFSSIAILSPGLLGGSLALAIRERMPGVEIRVWARREESVARVAAMGLADAVSTDVAAIAKGAGLIVFCMPIGANAGGRGANRRGGGPGSLGHGRGKREAAGRGEAGRDLSRAGGVRGEPPNGRFRANGARRSARGSIRRSCSFVTPEEATRRETVEQVADFWEKMGCSVAIATPRAHDEAVALVSHLPHLAAAVLVQTALRENPVALEWRGSGFLDTTRVASGPPAMWAEILTREPRGREKSDSSND